MGLPLQGVIDRDYLFKLAGGDREPLVQFHSLVVAAASLSGAGAAGVVQQDLAHGVRGDGEEVGAILPFHWVSAAHQAHVGLVDQRRGLERMAGTFASHAGSRHLAQLLENQRNELIGGFLVTVANLG